MCFLISACIGSSAIFSECKLYFWLLLVYVVQHENEYDHRVDADYVKNDCFQVNKEVVELVERNLFSVSQIFIGQIEHSQKISARKKPQNKRDLLNLSSKSQ